jgi:outer membrane protein assembly factor BamB
MGRSVLAWAVGLSLVASSHADDWPMLGRDATHNAVSPEKGAPTDWQIATKDPKTGAAVQARNVKWSAKLGTANLGGPVIANGLVWVATNNEFPRDQRYTDPKRLNPITKKPAPVDMSVLMCFRESNGEFLWQYASPRLRTSIVEDWPHTSLGNSPYVEGDRMWFFTNRSEVVCMDIGPLGRGTGQPVEKWKVDLRAQFGIFSHVLGMAMGYSPSVAVHGDRIFVLTGNGVDEGHINMPEPEAPSLVCLDKATGKALWTDNSPGKGVLHSQRSTALVAEIKGRTQVIVGQGDGWLRSFEAMTGRLIWKCDLNPKNSKYELGGRSTRNEVMATPVLHEGRVYIATGQDPEHYGGLAFLYCIDPTGEGDVSLELPDGPGKGKSNPDSRVVWRFGGPTTDPNAKRDFLFSRTLANATVCDGLVYATDIEGYAYCLDAKTGRLNWEHDLRSECWATPLWVENKVYVATEDGDVFVFAHGRDKKLLAKVEMEGSIRASPVIANGVLYIMNDQGLHAIQQVK